MSIEERDIDELRRKKEGQSYPVRDHSVILSRQQLVVWLFASAWFDSVLGMEAGKDGITP
jgi:hypothetical protein